MLVSKAKHLTSIKSLTSLQVGHIKKFVQVSKVKNFSNALTS